MRITVRGWGRDMGTKVLINSNLVDIDSTRDYNRRVSRNGPPGIFNSMQGLFIAWFQQLRHMGDYRMEVEFSDEDVIRLFKARFGRELSDWLVDEQGFTVSAELTKRVLQTVKLSDVTLGDLVAMHGGASPETATAEKLVEPSKITPFRRRV